MWQAHFLLTGLRIIKNHYPSWYLRFQTWKKLETFTKEISWQKMTIFNVITCATWQMCFYRPQRKFIIFVITEEVCTQMVLYLCQMFLKQKSWCSIHYSCWPRDKLVFNKLICKLLKKLSPGISSPRNGMILKLLPKKLFDK